MRRAHRARRSREGWLSYALVLPLAVVVIAPFLYMVVTVLMGEHAALHYPPLAGRAHFENFAAAFAVVPLGRFLLNSVVLSLAVAAGQVFTSAAAAYAFARLTFPGRDRVFLTYLAMLTVPAIVLVLPRFLLVDAFGWIDRYRGLISTELVSVAGIFLLRQFFRAIPRDLEDAARLEGAGEWTIFWRVIVPPSRPALATLAVLAVAEQWRSFLWPLVATRSSSTQPAEVGIANLQGMYDLSWPQHMAVATIAVAPLMVLFVVARKWFLRGIGLTGGRIGQT